MFDLLAIVGSAVVGDIIKRAISAGMAWGKRRKKPSTEEVRRKVEELVADAAQATPLPDSIAATEQKLVIAGITELTLPTFEQVVEYSPNTQRVVHAARSVTKKTKAKKAAAKKKGPAKKAARKKTARRKASKRG